MRVLPGSVTSIADLQTLCCGGGGGGEKELSVSSVQTEMV